ncbi:MAG: glycosyltransferase family 2 protein [Gemmataceae bacterium]|nr:glycosyltransferase family 2 protein [Gemmataceae bacterium]
MPNLYEPSHADDSDRVRLALERLHAEHRFDLIEFAVLGGLGFRVVQAKRAGLAFADAPLVARLDDTSRRRREAAERWPADIAELERDHAEQFSFEYADARITPDPAVTEYVRRLGWRERPAPVPNATARPLVTIGIAYHNLGAYLPDTLRAIAAQTYALLDVVIIDDGSTDLHSRVVFDRLEAEHPSYRFIRQPNAGIGAARNRCLTEARGDLFIPVDADNIARPEMVERFVDAFQRNPDLAAMTCYYIAFNDDGRHLYAGRPTGGPHTLAAIRNVYGDANAIFRTTDLRAVGGYETDRGTSCEDWEVFVKLAGAGRRVGVVPDHLFLYRHRGDGFSRVTNWFANHQRVLRQLERADTLPPGEAAILWSALLGFQQEVERLRDQNRCLRYRLADRLHAAVGRFPAAARGLKRLARAVSRRS